MVSECQAVKPEELVGKLLGGGGLSLGLAESCTGGMIAGRITCIPGSSAYFTGGVVAYDNRVKEGVLGVPGGDLEAHGAVSPQVARSMASGVKRLLKTDLGLSVTGIAGPGGGTSAKPVGLVYIALDGPGKVICREFHFGGGRGEIRSAAAGAALDMLRLFLLDRQSGQETVDSRQ